MIIILVRPQMGENIGACARVMKNFGLNELRIVSPRDGWPNDKAISTSVGASDLIHNAKIYNNIEEAISDINILYATSAQTRDLNKEVIFSTEISKNFDYNQKIGFLFGRESSGLSNAELIYANKLIHIPVDKNFSSLNIAQAVGIIAYEIFKNKAINNNFMDPIAPLGELNSMFEDLFIRLDNKDYFKVEEKRPQMMLNIKNIFSKASLSSQEIKTLRGIIKALSD